MELPPLEPGSIFLTSDEGPLRNSFTHYVICLGQFLREKIFRTSLNGDTSFMHAAVVMDSTKETLLLAEALIDGVSKNWVTLEALGGKMRGTDKCFIFTPKSSDLRAEILNLAEHSTSSDQGKMRYGFTNAALSVFKGSLELDAKGVKKVACALIDTIQGRRWQDISGKVTSEFCSSYVTLLLQTAYILQNISPKQITILEKTPRKTAIEFVSRFFVKNGLLYRLRCRSDAVQPAELFERLLAE